MKQVLLTAKGFAGNDMKILITGSSGTIGTRLFERLHKEHDVIGADIRQNKWRKDFNAKTIDIDLRRFETLTKLSKEDIDLVIHLAANARVYELVKNPELALHNTIINFNVLEFARANGIRRMIFASSRETYGNVLYAGAISEDMVRLENCESPYSASKLGGEALFHAYRKAYGVDTVIVRFSNVYGMYDDSDRVIPLWFRQCLNSNDDLIVYGKNKVLDFTYIDDAVDGVTKVIDHFDEIGGGTFNIAYGKGESLLDIAKRMKELTDSRNKIVVKENRVGEVWKFEADISRARRALGYKPVVAVDEGLKVTVEWYMKNMRSNGAWRA